MYHVTPLTWVEIQCSAVAMPTCLHGCICCRVDIYICGHNRIGEATGVAASRSISPTHNQCQTYKLAYVCSMRLLLDTCISIYVYTFFYCS